MSEPLTSHQIRLASGGTLAVSKAGQGPVLVCLHGFPLDHSMWVGQLAGLAKHACVIAPDLRGFGKSLGGTPVTSLD
ncbi:MAG: alpha/beta fold hydrolase, partial [Pirellulales bacterium]